MRLTETDRPLANTMWDFSWIERRYPGGGYDDWDRALDELAERGYDLARIDAFPHMIAADPDREWQLGPAMNDPYKGPAFPWGTPGQCTIEPALALREFVEKCAERDLLVGLTTWFRGTDRYEEVKVETPQEWGEIWIETLSRLENADLLDTIAFVDLENEHGGHGDVHWISGESPGHRHTTSGKRWMNESVETVRESYPEMDYTISFSGGWDTWKQQDVSALDFMEQHIFMHYGSDEFPNFIEFVHEDPWHFEYLDDLARKGGQLYRVNPEYWQNAVRESVEFFHEWAETADKPLVTTEAWAVPRARDWPELDWSWLKELDATGVRAALDTERFLSVCTSNHCGPQFRGMWEDVNWHRQLTDEIHNADIDL